MGGVVPKGESNDELIDNLIEADYLQTDEIIKTFRAVDRGDFFPGEYLEDAFKDLAMKHKNLHMSAPCIYSQVMENFELKPGLSVLNIGSGTGYLSTMFGCLLGINGINHGIDIHQDVLDYANQKVNEFIKFSDGFDCVNFCRPKFFLGNVNNLNYGFRQYDRVYCGACVPKEDVANKIKKLVKPNEGILIYPFGESLMKYKRTSPTTFEESSLLHVQFSDLLETDDTSLDMKLYSEPHTLQDCCRCVILKSITKERLTELDLLPIPNILIKYLKYYRDPLIPKPKREIKVRSSQEEEINFRVEIAMR